MAERQGLWVMGLDGVVGMLLVANAVVAGPWLWDAARRDPEQLAYPLVSPSFAMVGMVVGGLGALWWRFGRPGRGTAGAVAAFVVGYAYGSIVAMYGFGLALGYLLRDWHF
ncbi:hypothetical protein [Kribbella deserti]|uniref:Uncharacterized protein n=1 Tax=Kribbella deserti TaxID=1926257 RepID=A0ABV6QNQ4_9ACTN